MKENLRKYHKRTRIRTPKWLKKLRAPGEVTVMRVVNGILQKVKA